MDFLARAKLLGHDENDLKRGRTMTTDVTVNSLSDFRKIFAHSLTDKHRTAFAESTALDESSPMDALMHHVCGTRELTQADRAYAEKLFPVTIRATSGAKVTIDKDITYGPAAPPQVINAGTLEFTGGSITAITTSLTISADVLSVEKGGKPQYIVGILGEKGQDQPPGRAGAPYAEPAAPGKNVSAPTPGICTGAPNGGKGDNGLQGNPGHRGDTGGDGKTNLPANIAIGALSESNLLPLVVYTKSGAGGHGGKGGKGGTGQDGGHGGNGCDSGCEGTDGGNGGDAGKGGIGGKGGDGGSGVAGRQISISFPNANKALLQTIGDPALPGSKGEGGDGGDPGNPGAPGKGGKHKANGSPGGGNSTGTQGEPGSDGENTGAPGNFNIVWT